MSGSTTKKVVLERFDREPVRGFINPQTWLQESGVELLHLDGTVQRVSYDQVKVVCFVRDLEGPPVLRERREFRARPKSAGLWVELLFRDGDRMEGLIPNNLLYLEELGYTVTPPDAAGNTQKIFAPRASLKALNVLGVIGVPRKRKPEREEQQMGLF